VPVFLVLLSLMVPYNRVQQEMEREFEEYDTVVLMTLWVTTDGKCYSLTSEIYHLLDDSFDPIFA
jgi:hypothetical protein